MKKLCILSLIIGIGIGMIITASIHEIVGIQRAAAAFEDQETEPEEDIEQALGQLKGALIQGEGSKAEKTPDKASGNEEENKNEGISEIDQQNDQADELTSINIEILEGEEIEGYTQLIVRPGMTTQSIAEMLLEEELIEDVDSFIALAYQREVSKKFIAGRVYIPSGSTLDEIIDILIRIP